MEPGKRTLRDICLKKWSKEDKQSARLSKNNRIDPLKKKQYKDVGIFVFTSDLPRKCNKTLTPSKMLCKRPNYTA